MHRLKLMKIFVKNRKINFLPIYLNLDVFQEMQKDLAPSGIEPGSSNSKSVILSTRLCLWNLSVKQSLYRAQNSHIYGWIVTSCNFEHH